MSYEQIQLIEIVSSGQIRALKELLSQSADLDVNLQDECGNLAAVIAAQHNDLSMLKLLVHHGAQLGLKDGFGCTPIQHAKKNESSEMIKFITGNLSLTATAKQGLFSEKNVQSPTGFGEKTSFANSESAHSSTKLSPRST